MLPWGFCNFRKSNKQVILKLIFQSDFRTCYIILPFLLLLVKCIPNSIPAHTILMNVFFQNIFIGIAIGYKFIAAINSMC